MNEDQLIRMLAREYNCNVPTNIKELADFLEVMLNNIALRQDIDIDKYEIALKEGNKKVIHFRR